MKIGLVTIVDRGNYGNRLQNFAVQRTLENCGYEVETIKKIQAKKTLSMIIKYYFKKITGIKYTRNVKREEAFDKFDNKNIKYSKYYIKSDEPDYKLSNKYDFFACGSDQLWNPMFKTNTDAYYLSFVKGKKKISIAASFGIEKVDDEEDKIRIGSLLDKFNSISVREQSGKTIVEELSSKEATVLVDPTMMVTAEEWKEVERKPKGFNKTKYICCYFLGAYNQKRIDMINSYADDLGCEVVFMENQYYKYKITTEEEFAYGPDEFVWLIRNSEKVITDSFHAMVFSLLFRKDFLIIPRETSDGDMSSRFKNLEKIFKINDYIYCEEKGLNQRAIVDYNFFDKALNEQKRKFVNYIKESFSDSL